MSNLVSSASGTAGQSLVLPGYPPRMQISTLKCTSSVCQLAQQELPAGISWTENPTWRAHETISVALFVKVGKAVRWLPLKLICFLQSAHYLCSETGQGAPGPSRN